ncbi:MAG: heme-binding protein [bacterium]|nr:heme-binding protein [bacterium]
MKVLQLFPALLVPMLLSVELGTAQDLEQQLSTTDPSTLAAEALSFGDARRGAVVFYQADLACTRCHIPDEASNRLGPDLTALGREVADEHLIESILRPSKAIREGYEPVVLEVDEQLVTGLLVSENAETIILRDSSRDYKEVRFERAELSSYRRSSVSAMPSGLVNLLASKQQFLDLVRYLTELRDGGSARARELEPDPALYALRPLPAYEKDIDHAGFLEDLDQEAFERGRAIYQRTCVNCHGTHEQEGSLPTSLRFASQPFKNGSDPHTMYRTLTSGFGMMAAQTWMVPSQKYDVIHYVRQAYLKDHNPTQHFEVDGAYLARLPKGTARGPEPAETTEWLQMDYGPNQMMTLEVGDDGSNFAYKGNAIRLDAGPGGVAQGRYWMLYDYDTLRVAAAWSGDEFIDWNSIHFNGRHAIHPRIAGELHLENPTGPGWGRPADGSFEDSRLVGRDDRRYGPLARDWAQYRGMYYHGPDTLIEYTVGKTRVLEMPGVLAGREALAFTRTFNVGARDQELVLQVAHVDDPLAALETDGGTAWLGALHVDAAAPSNAEPAPDAFHFDGSAFLELTSADGLHAGNGDFTLAARIRTDRDGTIVALTGDQAEWVRDGLTWFVRGGRLTIDIGWVGAFQGSEQVADNEWHEVAVRYRQASGEIQFFVDSEADERVGHLRREAPLADPVVRIGYTASNFPSPSLFEGKIAELRFFNAALESAEVEDLAAGRRGRAEALAGHWHPSALTDGRAQDRSGQGHHAEVRAGEGAPPPSRVAGVTVAGVEGEADGMRWSASAGDLRLHIPAGNDAKRFTLWFATSEDRASATALADAVVIDVPARDLAPKTKGGPARWAQVLTSEASIGADDGPFAVDVLKRPTDNPWFCRIRLTGFDFTDGGDTAIVSAWDGSIWKVSGLNGLPGQAGGTAPRSVPIHWRRIASGLFQPLGVKILNGEVYVTCRDEIVILHDLNGDEEIDWFECFNNDHQVTEHFHEFAMGLQSDAEGNLLYAKSARHALPALVPHHGTLLRVSKDGQRTEIVASGFRAANGVCINSDGTFIVTDQEGHWNPKNRINYVKPGGFYGNMYGYHDVTDESDSAMEQPLAWITNSFDRSPGELLWVDSPKWGPLEGQLLNLSYGYGRVYVVPHEDVGGQMQGGMCSLPIEDFPTGVMRGRFHPGDGQLYLAGMFAWAGSQQQPGGLYRLRYTGRPVHLPVELSATKTGLTLRFSGELDRTTASLPANYHVKAWDLKRTRNYGSPHLNEQTLQVASAVLAPDGQTVLLAVPDIAPTWCMEIRYELSSAAGEPVRGKIHNTIHRLK